MEKTWQSAWQNSPATLYARRFSQQALSQCGLVVIQLLLRLERSRPRSLPAAFLPLAPFFFFPNDQIKFGLKKKERNSFENQLVKNSASVFRRWVSVHSSALPELTTESHYRPLQFTVQLKFLIEKFKNKKMVSAPFFCLHFFVLIFIHSICNTTVFAVWNLWDTFTWYS